MDRRQGIPNDSAVNADDAPGPMPFGDWVRRQRRTLDLTQAALAHCVGCALDTVKKIETGARRPSVQMTERLADCLRVPAEMHVNFLHAGRTGFIVHTPDSSGAAGAHKQPASHNAPIAVARAGATGASSNLPVQLTRFVGRKSEIAGLAARMNEVRLLTLTGTGGVGKTRLAIEVATRLQNAFVGGVTLVELAPIDDAALVPQTVALAFKLLELADRTHVEALCAALRDKHALLVLDNCEHVIGAAAELVETLLRACPRLHVLATSRERLRIPGEAVWRVPSLITPDASHPSSFNELHDYEAVQLFTQTAALAQPGFTLTPDNAPAVAQICQRLGGIPLALEMAAAQAGALSVQEIAAGLEDQLALLVTGSRTALLRHQTLRAALDWSYALLNAPEQVLLAQLSVFAGGFTAEAAQAICAVEAVDDHMRVSSALFSLVQKSLVVAGSLAGRTRYRLLEVVRQYAAEKLAAQSADGDRTLRDRVLRDRHFAYYLEFAEATEPKLHTGEATRWQQLLELEHDNLRAAINWAFERGDASAGLRLVAALALFWGQRYFVREKRWQLHRALRESNPEERTATRAKVLNSAGRLACVYREVDEADRLLDEALSIGMELNDQASVAQSQLTRGHEAFIRGDNASARTRVEQALAIWHALGDSYYAAFARIHLAVLAEGRGDDQEARRLLEVAIGALASLGEQSLRARSLFRLARLALRADEHAPAAALCRQSLALILPTGPSEDAPSCLLTFSGVALASGHSLQAAHLLGAVTGVLDKLGIPVMYGDAAEYERVHAAVHAQLNAAAFEDALAEGKRMTFEQAAAYALATT